MRQTTVGRAYRGELRRIVCVTDVMVCVGRAMKTLAHRVSSKTPLRLPRLMCRGPGQMALTGGKESNIGSQQHHSGVIVPMQNIFAYINAHGGRGRAQQAHEPAYRHL